MFSIRENDEILIFKSINGSEVYHNKDYMTNPVNTFCIYNDCDKRGDSWARIGSHGHYQLPKGVI